MAEGIYIGTLKLLGGGEVTDGSITKASVIEIGDKNLQNISYNNFIGTYLGQAITSANQVALLVRHDEIVALKMNGKIYKPEGGIPSQQDIKSLRGLLLLTVFTIGFALPLLIIVGLLTKKSQDKMLQGLELAAA